MATQNKNNTPQQNQFSIKDFASLCLSKWPWFVASLLVAMTLAFLYLKKKQPIYTRTTEVMIKEDGKSGSSLGSQLGSLGEMGMFNSSSNVNNELLAIKSPYVMLEVVNRLHLDVNYTIGRFRKRTLYGHNLPAIVTLPKMGEYDYVKMKLGLKANGTFVLSDIEKNDTVYEGEYGSHLNATVKTPIGKIMVSPGLAWNMVTNDMNITVTRVSPLITRQNCVAKMNASIEDKKAAVILMSYQDVSTDRADDILNTVVQVYQEFWMKDKNQIANSTSRFIDERLDVIEKELGNVDSDISAYKSRNMIPDIEASTRMSMANANEAGAKLVDLNNQLYMVTYIKEYVQDNSKRKQPLPSGMVPQNPSLESQINSYNSLVLERNSLVSSSSEGNALVVDMDSQIAAVRQAISASLDNAIKQLKIQISGIQGRENQNNAQVASSPTQAKHLLSVERQQKVKEALYIFLLQKREENQLSQAFTAYNTRIITPPMGGLLPSSPNKRNIMMLAFMLGLLLPAAVLYLLEILNTKIRGKKDIEDLSVPFIGEVPLYGDKKKRSEAETKILVQPKKRNMINEAFRVVRTNIEFMANSYENAKVFMVTSINVGSGKTFLTINMASSFAIKEKKTIVIDLDIRKASLSRYLRTGVKKGISSYLSGQETDWRKLIAHADECPELDVLPCGTIPPNPAELLSNGKLDKLIEELRAEYDVIFLDCAPVDVVADTTIVANLADITLFIIRTGLLDKELLPVIEEYYQSKKLKNMAVILNGTEVVKSKYGYHRRGYGYGYGYGSKAYGSYTEED
jgi:capsular exopolysaccharide synthesis family protein